MQLNPPSKGLLSTSEEEREILYLVLGRMLADRGFRDLFVHDPRCAAEMMKVSLTSEQVEKLRGYLARLDSASSSLHRVINAQFNSYERSKQY